MLSRIKKNILTIVVVSFLLAASEFLWRFFWYQFYSDFRSPYSLISRIPDLLVYNFVLHICLVGLLFLVVSLGMSALGAFTKLSPNGYRLNLRRLRIALIVFVFLFLYYRGWISFGLSLNRYVLYYFLFVAVAGIVSYIVCNKFGRLGKILIYGYGGLLLLVSGVLIIWSFQVKSRLSDKNYAAGLPNIMYIVVDTLRADALSCYGNKAVSTPNIDGLAADGILFENTFSSSSWTIPGTATLLTSRYPSSLNMFSITSILPPETVLISEELKKRRYVTAALIGNPLVNEKLGINQGFDRFDCWANGFYEHFAGVKLIDSITRKFLRWKNIKPMREDYGFFPVLNLDHRFVCFKRNNYRRGEEITKQALGLIKEMLPYSFFLYLHYFDPHDPYFEHPYKFLPYVEFPTKEKKDELISSYLGEVRYLDEQIGRLIDELKASGAYERTIIILAADHGEQFFEHGKLGHGKSLHDEELRIPLIIKGIGNEKGIRISKPVSTVDILPTVFDMLNINPPSDFEGKSLYNPDTKTRNDYIFGEFVYPPYRRVNDKENNKYFFSLLDNNFKYIISSDTEVIEAGDEELYDLRMDREEKNNIAAEKTGLVARYREIILKRYRELPKAIADPKRRADKEQLNLLKALGYIQ
jgi:arylsulfatase A-like enzyme